MTALANCASMHALNSYLHIDDYQHDSFQTLPGSQPFPFLFQLVTRQQIHSADDTHQMKHGSVHKYGP